MRISIRTALLIVLTIAAAIGFYSFMARTTNVDLTALSIEVLYPLATFVLMFVSFCGTGASIAHDREPTLRSAARGALNGFYVWVVFGILAGLYGMPRVT